VITLSAWLLQHKPEFSIRPHRIESTSLTVPVLSIRRDQFTSISLTVYDTDLKDLRDKIDGYLKDQQKAAQ
jgi:hypothetical protein